MHVCMHALPCTRTGNHGRTQSLAKQAQCGQATKSERERAHAHARTDAYLVLMLEGESLAKVVVLGGVEQNVLQVFVGHDALQVLCVLRACMRWRAVNRDRLLQGARARKRASGDRGGRFW